MVNLYLLALLETDIRADRRGVMLHPNPVYKYGAAEGSAPPGFDGTPATSK